MFYLVTRTDKQYIDWMGDMPTFGQFERLCSENGLVARKVNHSHWQIIGGLRLVNVYPLTKRGTTYYVQGMSRGLKGTTKQAVEAAKKPPRQEKRHSRNSWKKNKKVRDILWHKQEGLCKWCRHYVLQREATLDHIVSLSHGGGNGLDNLCMACGHCNAKRGNKCTEDDLKKGATP